MWALSHQEDPAQALTAELHPKLTDSEAAVEASRCLECGGGATAPCTVACPAGVDVPGFIGAIREGLVAESQTIIFAANPLGGTCARVCPAEVLCEGACVLERTGLRAVAIARLQRYAVDHGSPAPDDPVRPIRGPRRRIAVIGAGPAGLACAAEMSAAGHVVTVYDEHEEVGGLVRYAIAPYRQVRDPLPMEVERLSRRGVDFRLGVPIDSPARVREIEHTADAIFLGVGLGDDVPAAYEGRTVPGVYASLDFIRRLKTGHWPSVGHTLAVIGGGNTAIDVAREAVRLGVPRVLLIYRRSREAMPAFAQEVAEAEAEGVEFLWMTSPVRFLGSGRLTGVVLQRMQQASPDASGRAGALPVPGTEYVLAVDTVVLAIGQRSREDFLAWIPGLRVERGCVVHDPATGQTGNLRYFVGGDAANGGATVVEAVREGKIAAFGMVQWLLRSES